MKRKLQTVKFKYSREVADEDVAAAKPAIGVGLCEVLLVGTGFLKIISPTIDVAKINRAEGSFRNFMVVKYRRRSHAEEVNQQQQGAQDR